MIFTSLACMCSIIFVIRDGDLLCYLMWLANQQHDNKGGIFLEKNYSNHVGINSSLLICICIQIAMKIIYTIALQIVNDTYALSY